MENSRNKQFISFTLHAILSSVMKSRGVQRCPAQDVNHPLVPCVLSLSYLVALSVIRRAVSAAVLVFR